MVKHSTSGSSNPQVRFRRMVGISDSGGMIVPTDRTPDWRMQKGDFRNPGRWRPQQEQGYQIQQKPLTSPPSPFLLNQHSNQDWGQTELCSCPSSVLLLSRVRLSATPRTAAHQASLSITNSRRLMKLHRVGDAIQPSLLCQSGLICFNIFL